MPRVDTQTFYESALAAHGETPEGVHWNSTESQEMRFQVMRTFLPEDLSGVTLVDAGCGFGDFYRYLDRCGERPGEYIGLDVMEPMVKTARVRTGCEILLRDVLSDPLPRADYYLCSGAMNTLTRVETRQFILNCYAASATGFVFNLLKGWDTSPIYNYYHTREIEQLGQELNADYRIADDYMVDDLTAIFRKPPPT